jgi:quinolinate synthase
MITYPTASVFPPCRRRDAPAPALQQEVIALKKAKDALILAHNYQCEDIQGVADYVGDSLELWPARPPPPSDEVDHRVLRRALHGRDGQDPEPEQAGACSCPTRAAGCSLADSCPADKLAAASRPTDPQLSTPSPTSTAAPP